MTVHGLDYRPGSFAPTAPLRRLWPLAVVEFRVLFRGVWGALLYGLCALPTLFRLLFLLVHLGVIAFGGPARGLGRRAPHELRGFVPTNPEFYLEQIVAIEQGIFVFLLLTSLTTARAIAKDRATNALELYWTRGITPAGYFAAKWFGSFLLVGTLSIAAPMALWAIGVLLAEDWTFWTDTAPLMPGVLLGLTVFTVVLTVLCILVSAASASANLAMIGWCVLIGGSRALGEMLGNVLGGSGPVAKTEWLSCVSLWDAAGTLARGCAGIAPRGASLGGALALVSGLWIVLALLVWRRLRVTEAIA